MITQEDFNFISHYEQSKDDKKVLLDQHKMQCAKSFINLMTNISKDQTVQYILTLIDDMLQVIMTFEFIVCTFKFVHFSGRPFPSGNLQRLCKKE